ncbi:MAG: nucleoside deaminase [Gammaproteobacteria bacterium]|nr:nucleoside deaminase [Gammaproteobacteria bacterium]
MLGLSLFRRKPPGASVNTARRRSVVNIIGLGLLANAARAATSAAPIVQPSDGGHRAFMSRAEAMRALALADGDQGYGAVIVKDGRIVGQSPSRVVVNGDPTGHAETEAIRDACRRLGSRDLRGCVMYSTTAACAMCETAAYWANVERMYAGAAIADQGAPRYGGC